jgi:hypothetical protein
MRATRYIRAAVQCLAAGAGLGAAAYLTHAYVTWCRYGGVKPANDSEADSALDRFIPAYDVVERHRVHVGAPAEITFAAETGLDLTQSVFIRAIFRGRELILGAQPNGMARPHALVAQMKALGWGVLAEVPGREIVIGAITQPWLADVEFRALPNDQFAAFHEPGYVKIAWTLRADPLSPGRVATTDQIARAKFRRYWSFFSPGIVLIRKISLGLVKREAQRRARKIQGLCTN